MQRGYVLHGRLRGRHIDLDETVEEIDGEVELFVKPLNRGADVTGDILDVVDGLPSGTLSKADIDARIQAARAGWDDRG
jgi:hypothetical protein